MGSGACARPLFFRRAGGAIAITTQDTVAHLRRLGSGGADDRLDWRLMLAIFGRCFPLLRGVRRHLFGFLVSAIVLVALGLPFAMMGLDIFWTGVLQGKPLPDVQARALLLDPAVTVHVDALSLEARKLVRDHLLVGSLLWIVVLGLPLTGVFVYYYVWITQRINQDLRVMLHDRLQSLSLRFHADHRVGDALYRLHQDSAMVADLMEALVLTPLFHMGRYALATAAIALFDWRVALVFALAWPPSLLVGAWFSRRMRVGFRAARERNAALTARIQEILAAIQVVKAYGAEPAAQQSFEEHSRDAFSAAFDARFLVCLFSVVTFVIVCAAMLAATGLALVSTRQGTAVFAAVLLGTVGFDRWTLGAFNFFKGEMGWGSASFRVALRMWARLQDMAIGLDRVFELLDMTPEVEDAPDAVDFPALARGVAFRDVSFRYQPDRPAVESISLEARPGTVTAIVGPTGSGKTTLGVLLLRLFDPDHGSIEIDGVDLRRIRLASLRANVAIALQENMLFGATVRENIRYAVPGASDAAVREAARVACADEFIRELPEDYETQLGERGTKLSSGQRQRLSIARALIKDAPILILDEPTASLDAETELRLLDNLAVWGRGRVVFLVTHRISTIRRADRILVMEQGRLVEGGPHAELVVRAGGTYRRLVEHEAVGAP